MENDWNANKEARLQAKAREVSLYMLLAVGILWGAAKLFAWIMS